MILQSLKMAWKSIVFNKLRSFLTMLGIIIGVVALVVLVSLVKGATSTVTDSVSSLGSNLLLVSVMDDKGNPLKMADLEKISSNETIHETAPLEQTSLMASGNMVEKNVSVYGTTDAYFRIQKLNVAYGRVLKSVDYENHNEVAVISSSTATEIMGRMDVVGEKIRLNGVKYTIVGVLEENKNAMSSLAGQQYEIYIPLSTMIRVLDGFSSNITSFYASAEEEDLIDQSEAELKTILLDRFKQDENAFYVMNQSSVMKAMSTVTGTLSLLLGGIAAISLLVGGIGIMNIMLVSVTERTREIGIRKAIGAGRGIIMFQFLIEALSVSLFGCAIGIFLSWAVIQIINLLGKVNYGFSMGIVGVAVSFSMGIGLLFGLYPANKAAKMKPIDALRYIG